MLTLQQVKLLVKKEYEIECKEVKPLHGYIDQNFRLRDSNGSQYVLRIINPLNFGGEDLGQAIDEVREYLYRNGFKVPHTLKTKDGNNRFYQSVTNTETAGSKTLYAPVQLSLFVPGRSIVEADLTSSAICDIAEDVGKFCGLVHSCLRNYLLAKKTKFDRDLTCPWYTMNFLLLKPFANFVENVALRNVIEKIFGSFENKILKLVPSLRHNFVHGDFSSSNIIVINVDNKANPSIKDRFGVIDFEHCHFGPLVFDLTICIAYMLTTPDNPDENHLLISQKMLKGYQQQMCLTATEKEVLFLGVLARLVSSYLMALRNVDRDPANEAYSMIAARKCPKLIQALWDLGEKETLGFWLKQ